MLRLRTRHGTTVLAALLFLGAASAAQAQAVRYNHSMTLMVDGNILIVGGKGAANTSLATVDIKISTANKFETRANLNTARSSHTATVLPDGRVLVTGGVDGGGAILDTGEVFDPRLNTWTTIPNTNFGGPRVNHTATILPNGKVLIAGGQTNAGGNVLASCALFSGGAFAACGAMNMARAGHTATALHNGRVFVAGGYRDPGVGVAGTTELYDLDQNAWFSGPALSQGRCYHTATQMGNQRVLIAGGYNAIDFQQSLGFLGSTEIYDPNSGTVTPGPTMSARKMHQTANLRGVGTVNLYGGLGNITTSYVAGNYPASGSFAVTPTGANTGTVDNFPTSTIQLEVLRALSAPVNGRIVDGDFDIAGGVIKNGSAFTVTFAWPGSTIVSLDGVGVSQGEINSSLTMTGMTGATISYPPLNADSKDVDPITAGQVTTAAPAQPGVSTTLTGGTLTGQISVPVDISFLGGTVLAGSALIVNGQITKPSGAFAGGDGFDVALTSGAASIVGGTITLDNSGAPALIMNVTFNNLRGSITNSTTVPINSPMSLVGLKITPFSLNLTYVISRVTLPLGATLDTTLVSTVAVRVMQFSDQERYTPNANTFALGTPGFPTFNHNETLLPNGDEFVYGGRSCSTQPTCSAFTYSALNSRGSYILLHSQDNPWTAVGTLSAPRANHTLNVLPDGRVLAAGGEDASNTVGVTELFRPVERDWIKAADMKQRRSHHTATLLPNGNVLVAGGFTALNQSTGTSRHAEIFYPETATWVVTAPMASSRAYHSTVLLPDGNPAVFGGFQNGTYLSSMEVFFSTAHKWLPGPPIGGGGVGEERAQFTATMLHDGRILVTGGVNAVGGVLNTTRIFDPTAWSWAAGPAMFRRRHSHTANLLRDGRVLVAGGSDGNQEISLAEVFDPATNLWTQTTAAPISGNDLSIPRLGHTATLLPDGKLMMVGGFTTLGGPILEGEGFDVDSSTFQNQGPTGEARGDHATVLLRDGFLLTAGGFNGLSYSGRAEILYAGAFPDVVTLAGGQRRRPLITRMIPSLVGVGSQITAVGENFKGMTEASGGGAGSANSHHTHPRVYLQRADSASSSANDSGWMIDLTSGMYHSGVNSFDKMDASLTFHVPYTSQTIPLGWYHMRVAANDQFSESATFQVGPPRPTGTPGIPTAVVTGPSSVVWTWAAAAGTFDGYNVYSATNGVFLSTIARSGGATETFLQTGLGPDTSSLIKVAPFNISGDGTVTVATTPVLTGVSLVNDLIGLAQTTKSLFWSWNSVNGATGYNVYASSTAVLIATTPTAAFTQTDLSTNTAYSIFVQAIMSGGNGQLSATATAYTLAAQPSPGFPPLHIVSTGSFVAQWLTNTNPNNTRYHVKLFVGASTEPIHFSSISLANHGLTGGTPNTLHTVHVAAFNGDGIYTAFTTLGSTYTFARPPTLPRVLTADPSGISLDWSANGNPGDTAYQILYSTDNFVANFSTFALFSAAYTSASVTIPNLITGTTYTVRIAARNSFGQETSAVAISAFTDNGGGPIGSLSLIAPTTVYATLSGTLGSGRRFEIRIPPGSFDVDTRLFITSYTAANLAGKCGGINTATFQITNIPAVQPRLPIEVGLQFIPGEVGALATLGMGRYDPFSDSCVPMESRVDTATNMLYARLNHFSDFKLMQMTAGASASSAGVFPNPLYTNTQGFFTFKDLPGGASVRIFTLHGEELFEGTANASGLLTWRPQNKVGRNVASGLYLAVIESGGEKKIMKLAVVR